MTWFAHYAWIIGAVIVGAVLIQAMWMLVDAVRGSVHAQAQRRRAEHWLELRIAQARKRRTIENQISAAWSGWRKFQIRRRQIEDANQQICSFYLEPHDGKPIGRYSPGQFLTLQVRIPGQPKRVVRCYSLSDSAKPDHYRITVKRVGCPPDIRDAPPGVMSNFIHDNLKEGDILDVRAPAGVFTLDAAGDRPVVLIGGGIGVTPVLSMLNAIIESGSMRETWFFYGVRHQGEHILPAHFQEVAQQHPNIHICVCYSNPAGDDVKGTHYHYGERISVDLLKRVLPSNNYDFFLCGPNPMMDCIVEGLGQWGVPEERVHLEKFGPGAARKAAVTLDPKAAGPAVTFKKSSKTVHWDDRAEHLWEFANANGVKIDCGCLEGNCGTCRTAILSGKVKYTKTPGYVCEQGTCLVCCCVPVEALELDA